MDKKELFSIGETARMLHLSPAALRHYEKAGLLCPEYTDPATGYRYYSTRQFEVLNTIRYLRTLDFSLEQIAGFLHSRNPDTIRSMLLEQKRQVQEKQKELNRIERKIEARLEQLDDTLQSTLDQITQVQAPAHRIAWISGNLQLHSYLDLEEPIRQLDREQSVPSVFLGKVGVGIRAENLEAGRFDRYDLVFLMLDPADEYTGKTDEWPETTCVSIRFCGSHARAPEYYRKLQAYMLEHDLEITGCSREITLVDEGMSPDPDRFVTEIQIPVRPKDHRDRTERT